MKTYSSVIILTAIFTGIAIASFSQPGTLDASFGNGGKVVTPVGDSSSVANSIVVTPEGKIVVGGYSFIAGQAFATLLQYNNNGTLDTAFGENGKALLSPLAVGEPIAINNIALQPDGKIVAAGYSDFKPLIIRYKADGNFDSTFGVNGKATPIIIDSAIYIGGAASKVIVKPDGNIVVGGATYTAFFDNIPFVMQYLPDGTIDSSFGTNGATYAGMSGLGYSVNDINDIAVMDNDNITLAINEYVFTPVVHMAFQLGRLLANGTYDSTFGVNGIVRTGEDSTWEGGKAYSVVVLPDSSIVAAGYLFNTTQTILALIKYHSNGTTDSTFGINGKASTALTGYISDSKHLLRLPDGKLLVSGSTYPSRDFVLVKFLPDGIIDSSFGVNGIMTTDFSGTDDINYSSALQLDGKIVLAGNSGNNTNYDIALARYNNNIIYPLRLLSFTAMQSGNKNLLQWQTSQEVNTNVFDIQRSSDGRNYSTIGSVNVDNNFYSFIDNAPLNGNNYYRLKIVERDGSFTNSAVKVINNSPSLLVNVYPNPARNVLRLQISNDKETVLQWRVISADGKVLIANQWQLQAGSSVKSINVAALPEGNYYLKVTEKNNRQSVIAFEKL